MPNTAEIRIDRLSKRFGDLRAVNDVSLHIPRGSFTTFLGPSGCGKTTLLRMIAGFVRPDAGEIYLDDEPVSAAPPWERGVGLVFQNFALFPHMNVFENVAFGLREQRRPASEVRDRVGAALALVDLEGLQDRRPSQLSGGQQQRVALARTLVVEPRGLLLDEPLSNLDARLRVQMRAELVRIQQELGITTVYVTHDQEEALALSTRIAVFSHGAVVQEGTPREIYETPGDRLVADFVGHANILEGRAGTTSGRHLQVDCPDIGVQTVGWTTSFSSVPAAGTPLLVVIRPESLVITETPAGDVSNLVPGQVLSTSYLGALLQVDVRIPGGRVFKVDLPNPRQRPSTEPGTQVTLTYSPDDAVLIRPGEPHPG